MFLKNLRLFNFKNFEEQKFDFSKKINCFTGNNGIGKTNILDSIYYLSLTKSYLNYTDANNIKFGEKFFVIEGDFIDDTHEDNIKLLVQLGVKKVLKKNNKPYDKLSDHIGNYPVVMISPYDQNLITEGSEFRRKFIDGMISQIDKEYLHLLIRYQKALVQRNALLKLFAVNHTFDSLSLEFYNKELVENGVKIYSIRKKFIEKYLPNFINFYSILSQGKEGVTVQYISDLEEQNFEQLLNDNLSKDRAATHTTKGIHKDDLVFILQEQPIKKFGSQGQQKSFLIALKLAQLQIIKDTSQKQPLLLMDDIFDKLDESRVAQLVKLTHEENFGQIFLSDTYQERTEAIVKQISADYNLFSL